jgi:hypothetical protein
LVTLSRVARNYLKWSQALLGVAAAAKQVRLATRGHLSIASRFPPSLTLRASFLLEFNLSLQLSGLAAPVTARTRKPFLFGLSSQVLPSIDLTEELFKFY